MPGPASLSAAAVGAAALTEGIKFLYSQAGEILKRWRMRRDRDKQYDAEKANASEAVEVDLPEIFEGQLKDPEIHFGHVKELKDQLRELRKELSDYAEEIEAVNETDPNLLKKVNALRNLLEIIFQQSITFRGEKRRLSGSPVLLGIVEAIEIAGDAIGVDVETVTTGEIRGEIQADRIERSGKAIGVKVDTIGGNASEGKSSDK